jgi:hypothetical protein
MRSVIGPVDYELTPRDPATSNWLVLESWHGGLGVVFAFREKGRSSVRVRLQGLAAKQRWQLVDAQSNKIIDVATGRALRHGLRIHVATPWSARVLLVQPFPHQHVLS